MLCKPGILHFSFLKGNLDNSGRLMEFYDCNMNHIKYK